MNIGYFLAQSNWTSLSLPVVFPVEDAGTVLPSAGVTDFEPEITEVAPKVFSDVNDVFLFIPFDTSDFWRL